ncbi:TIGR03756 family integrating conjugative element protein [Pseudomonas edaphica]|uniref:TIGR03756 family integrating conjugative element protein n=1 Tax=Pseudomonas edaphica TaxID=2006980 RepID=A0ABY2U2Q2_9PSED|nr:TIGR03756 family integrating conjugative element protein [Pseudomonas edaphica]TLG88302.1 TIGR03756 family integrating conjugative element protein [Pseudomonas edaphica]
MTFSTHKTCLRRSLVAILLGTQSLSVSALNSATITASALSADCLAYRVVGLCYWLRCTPFGCSVRTSPKVRHYVPDAVVSSYSNTGQNPWLELRPLSLTNPTAQGGGDGTTASGHENNLSKFKNADAIGHPAGALFNQFVGQSGYVCPGAGKPLMPYLLSTLDTIAWRYNIPEAVFPEALMPGLREVGSRLGFNLWGAIYPRGGFLHQVDDFKAAAVVAQRAGDIVTRMGQLHVYQPLIAFPYAGYWPPGPLLESDSSTGKWQTLAPIPSTSCAVFPNNLPTIQSEDGGYAWALWRPYSCCKRQGQTFLGSTDFTRESP